MFDDLLRKKEMVKITTALPENGVNYLLAFSYLPSHYPHRIRILVILRMDQEIDETT
jgi:hypothetical protein